MAPAQGPAAAGIHIYTVINTYTRIHIAYRHAHTGQFSLTSIPSQTNTTFSSLLVSQFHLANVHPTSSWHPNRLPIAIIYSTQEPPQIITNMPSHTTSLPSPRLSPIHSQHHLDLHLLTTNITHITQKSTNTTPQQQIVM